MTNAAQPIIAGKSPFGQGKFAPRNALGASTNDRSRRVDTTIKSEPTATGNKFADQPQLVKALMTSVSDDIEAYKLQTDKGKAWKPEDFLGAHKIDWHADDARLTDLRTSARLAAVADFKIALLAILTKKGITEESEQVKAHPDYATLDDAIAKMAPQSLRNMVTMYAAHHTATPNKGDEMPNNDTTTSVNAEPINPQTTINPDLITSPMAEESAPKIKSIGDEKAEPPPLHWSGDAEKFAQFLDRVTAMYKQFGIGDDEKPMTAPQWYLNVAGVKDGDSLSAYKGTGKQLLEALLQDGILRVRAEITSMIEDANHDYKLNLDPDKVIVQMFGTLEKVARDGLTRDQMMAQASMCVASSRQNREIAAMNTATGEANKQRKDVMIPATTGDPSLDILFVKANVLHKSGLMPYGVDTVEKIVTIGMMGQVLGLDLITAINMIDVISGKPTLKPQLMIALARRAGLLEKLDISDDGTTCTVTVKRKGESEYSGSFGMADADKIMTTEKVNGDKRTIKLSQKSNWVQQPKVMRQWRCVAAVWRVVFPDVVWGMAYTADELESADSDIIATDGYITVKGAA